jgi:hypothetical protein
LFNKIASAPQQNTAVYSGDRLYREGSSGLSAESKSSDLFYDVYQARCDTYKAMEGGKLGKTAGATGVLVTLAGIASIADTVAEIAIAAGIEAASTTGRRLLGLRVLRNLCPDAGTFRDRARDCGSGIT